MKKGKIEVGKYYKMPINGYKVNGFDFTYFIKIVFAKNIEDDWQYNLMIRGEYKLTIYGQRFKFQPTDIEGYKKLLDFSNEIIKCCQADKNGHLWLETEKGNIIEIEDGPFENWEFKIHKITLKFKTIAHLIGGVGRTVMLEY